MIYCEHEDYGLHDKYFCKTTPNECVYLQSNETQSTWVHKDRYSLRGSPGGLLVIVRQLSVQDTGSYQCGETKVWNHTVKLTVKSGEKQ